MRALVKNTADEAQVRYAGRKVEQARRRYRVALAEILQHPSGRIVVWHLLAEAGLYQTIFSTDALEMARRAGKREFGLELLSACVEADERAYLVMEREARAWERGVDRESEAVQLPAATDE